MLTVVWGLILYDDEILIGKKKEGYHPYGLGGKWHVIGGKVEKDETEEEALRREVREETGVEVENLRKLGEKTIEDSEGRKIKLVILCCKAKSKHAKAMSDLEEVKWVRKESLLDEVCEKVRKDLLSVEGVREFLNLPYERTPLTNSKKVKRYCVSNTFGRVLV